MHHEKSRDSLRDAVNECFPHLEALERHVHPDLLDHVWTLQGLVRDISTQIRPELTSIVGGNEGQPSTGVVRLGCVGKKKAAR